VRVVKCVSNSIRRTPEVQITRATTSSGSNWHERWEERWRIAILTDRMDWGQPMKTAAIYARYSSDLQKDRSIDDQIMLCRQIAARHGVQVEEVFTDRAKSGASMFERDGLLALMTAAKKRSFNFVISESLSRLSRDMEDTSAIYKRLKFSEIKILDSNGEVTDVHVGVGGIVNSQFLKNLATSVKRGRDARVREGLIPGKAAFGYRLVPGKPGVREIDPEQAKIVLRIFEEYASGISTRTICERLMAEGVPGSRGALLWNHQKLITGGAFGGLLGNQLYIGKLIWNAFYQVKNPENGKRNNRRSTEAPIEVDVPHLRIIPQDLWDRVEAMRKTRKTTKSGGGPRVYKAGDRTRLLMGLLHCSECGSRMIIGQANMDGTPRVVCASAYKRQGCAHQKSYCLRTLTEKTLDDVRRKLTDPTRLIELTRAYHERYAERQRTFRGERDEVQKQINRVTVQIDRIVAAISMIEDEPVEALVEKLKVLRVEKASLQHKLDLVDAHTNVVSLHPAAITKFSEAVKKVHAALTGDTPETELPPFRNAFFNMVHSIVVYPTPKRAEPIAEAFFRVAAVTGGLKINPEAPSIEQMLEEQGVSASKISSPTGSQTRQDLNSEGLISLGKWKQAA
jgi:DNA invertase Pin-like site-specific DNA recombinase